MIKLFIFLNRAESTEDLGGFTHGGFYVEGSDVLPSFLGQGNQEVDPHCDVLSEFFFGLVDVSDGGTKA